MKRVPIEFYCCYTIPDNPCNICLEVPLPLQLAILPQVLMMGISGHVRISLMRPNCMKLVPMIVNGWKCIRQIVALLHPRIRAAFSQIVPLPAIIMSQDM